MNNHYHLLIDVSGSMAYELRHLKTNLKNVLAGMKTGDMVSVMYYSCNNDCGYVLKNYLHKGIDTLLNMNNAIELLNDRGSTGFIDPLLTLEKSLNENEYPEMNNVVVFMSDGYENNNSLKDVLAVAKRVSENVNFHTGVVVEYGSYANHDLLASMADYFGSFHYAKDFNSFSSLIDNVIKTVYSEKALYVGVPSKYVFQIINGNIIRHQYIDSKLNASGYQVFVDNPVYIDDNFVTVYDESKKNDVKKFTLMPSNDVRGLLGVLYLAMVNNDSKTAFDMVKKLGFVEITRAYQTATTKSGINNFIELVSEYIQADDLDVREIDYSLMPNDDAFTVYDCLALLENDAENRVSTKTDNFKYNRIGSRKVQRTELVNSDDIDKLSAAKTADDILKVAATKYKLDFKDYESSVGGHPFRLTYNTERANISFNIKLSGVVDLTPMINNSLHKDEINSVLQPMFPTHVFRNYTIVRDGVLNIERLPFFLNKETYEKLVNVDGICVIDNAGSEYQSDIEYIVNLTKLPMINRNMLSAIDVENCLKIVAKQHYLANAQKVIRHLYNDKFPDEKIADYVDLYGRVVANILKDHGITSAGFNPPVVSVVDGKDTYVASKVDYKIKGYSTIPPVEKTVEKSNITSKLTKPEELLMTAYNDVLKALETVASENYEFSVKDVYDEVKEMYVNEKRNVDRLMAIATMQMIANKFIPSNDGYKYQDEYFDTTITIVIDDEEIAL